MPCFPHKKITGNSGIKKYTLHIGIWAGKRAAVFPLVQTGKSHLSTKLFKTPNLEALLERIPHDGTVIRFYKMLQHIFTRKNNFNIILCLIYVMNLEISKFSLTENVKLLSLRTVNISTQSWQRTVLHQVMIPVMIEASPPLWIRTYPPERLCNMWTPGGKNLQMQVLCRILCIIQFADGCCILSWFNLPNKKAVQFHRLLWTDGLTSFYK